jgi:membrane fusion protein, heavy metal efflux system
MLPRSTERGALRLLGGTVEHPSRIADLAAPVSGVITDQQVTNAASVQSLGMNPITISDLSYVWVVCDVNENDIPNVRLGDIAEVRPNAMPDLVLKRTVSNIGPIVDPNIRTAKVRIEVRNPGSLRIGMFAKADFEARKKECTPVSPPPPFCACTTAIGSTLLHRKTNSAGWR